MLVGADRVLDPPFRDWVIGKRVGLITNPAGVNSRLESVARTLARAAGMELAALFGPEHGFLGHESAERPVASTARVHSLYGQTQKPTPQMLAPVEVLVYDLQDVGTRFYTFISTLYLCMQAAAEGGIPFIVLDRPNPIGGVRFEGPTLDPDYRSFVGIFDLPLRYGLTAGELARLFNGESDLGCDLRVVPLLDWNRTHWYDQTGLEWICPSPELATITTAALYPGFCLLEGTNLSEGRGTVRPFELVGAPWLESEALATRLNALQLPGVRFRPQVFTPNADKFSSQACRGLQIHVLDRDRFSTLPVVLHLLRETIRLHPGKLEWREAHFDRLAGTDRVRRALLDGKELDSIVDRWQPKVQEFFRVRQPYLLYP